MDFADVDTLMPESLPKRGMVIIQYITPSSGLRLSCPGLPDTTPGAPDGTARHTPSMSL